jgi:NADH:ubiquinone oxidoreductase subunit K
MLIDIEIFCTNKLQVVLVTEIRRAILSILISSEIALDAVVLSLSKKRDASDDGLKLTR